MGEVKIDCVAAGAAVDKGAATEHGRCNVDRVVATHAVNIVAAAIAAQHVGAVGAGQGIGVMAARGVFDGDIAIDRQSAVDAVDVRNSAAGRRSGIVHRRSI